MHALVEEIQLERRLAVAPVRLVLAKAQFLIVGEGQLAQRPRQIALRRVVTLGGQSLGFDRHIVQIERPTVGGEQQGKHAEGQLAGLAQTGCRTATH
ncbi:hypothetical protein D3C86_2049100 [compost metagenome]